MMRNQHQSEIAHAERAATCGELYQIVRIDKVRALAHYSAQAAMAAAEASQRRSTSLPAASSAVREKGSDGHA